MGNSFLPAKAHAIPVVDANTLLANAISTQLLKPIPRRDCKFCYGADAVELVELAAGGWPQWFWASRARCLRVSAVKNIFGSAIRKRAYHGSYYNEFRYRWLVAELAFNEA